MKQLVVILVGLYEYVDLLAMVVTLLVVLSWRPVSGKVWLAGALLVTLSAELGAIVLQLLMQRFGPEMIMGPDDYEYLWQSSFVLANLSLLGKVLLVVAVFRLRAGLRSRQSPAWAGVEAGGE